MRLTLHLCFQQWVGLRRPHAEAIMADERVFAAFQEYCVSGMDKQGHYQQCKVSRCMPPCVLQNSTTDASYSVSKHDNTGA